MAANNGYQTDNGFSDFDDYDPMDYQPGQDLSHMVGLWQVTGHGSEEKGNYTDYVGLIDRSTLQRLNTLDDYFPEAVFENDEHREVVLGYHEAGMEQLYCFANNRLPILKAMRDDLAILDKCVEAGAVVTDDKESVLTAELEMTERISEDFPAELQKLRARHEERLEELIRGIRQDQRDGVFRDYSAVRQRWEEAVTAGEPIIGARVGMMMDQMPEFIQMAAAMCRATESNTRRLHIQSILARVTEKFGDFVGMRGARSARQSRRRSASTVYDDEE